MQLSPHSGLRLLFYYMAAPTTIRTLSRSKRVGQWPTRYLEKPMVLDLCGHVYGSPFTSSTHAANLRAPSTQGLLTAQLQHARRTTTSMALRGGINTAHAFRPNLRLARQRATGHSSLFVSTQTNIATSGKRHPCRFSLRECWIRSRARPFVLHSRCRQRHMTETYSVAFINYGGGLTVSVSASGPEKYVRDSALHAASAGTGRLTTAAPRGEGG